jgi:crotonobetainyl-CoA:carnitine CoA-transferase CaiB-like acyl-CoA transferase
MPAEPQILKDITVVDIGVGMAAALVSKFLIEWGATVLRVAPEGGDPFATLYPAYDVWRRGTSPGDLSALATADICITGGEDYPGLIRLDATALAARNPRLVVLNIEGYPAGTRHAGRPATDVLVQARSGLAYEHFSKRPLVMSFAPAHYGAALRGLCGLLAALYEREGSGLGQVVSTSMLEGAYSWMASVWCEVDKPTGGTRFVMPKDPYPLIFRCADGVYIHLVIGAAGSKYRMYQALEIDDPSVLPNDSGMPKPTDDPKNFFGNIDLLAEHVAKKPSAELLERIWALGLPAEAVLPPGECWDLPQLQHNGIIVTDPDGTRHVGKSIAINASPAARQAKPKTGRRPLDGVRAVDFGAFVAGPFATCVLAELGADIIKVETPAGDPNRGIFRSWAPTSHGKRAVSIDMKNPEGLALARAICTSSDIITNNFRTGVSARLGIDPVSLHKDKPELVVLESPGYGASGPLADRAAFDMVMQAIAGHEYRAGGKGNTPLWNRTSMVDYAGGFLGAAGALAALYHRARTGEGASISCALLSAGVFLLSELVQRPDGTFEGAEPLNATRTGYGPAEALYEGADGWLAIAVRGAPMAAALGQVLGLELPADPLRWGESEAERITAALRGRGVEEALAALEAAGVWAEKCNQGLEHETLNDKELHAGGTVRTSMHPQFGEIREFGGMLRFSRSASGTNVPPPLLGEHTRAVLAELGTAPEEIDALFEKKVVF